MNTESIVDQQASTARPKGSSAPPSTTANNATTTCSLTPYTLNGFLPTTTTAEDGGTNNKDDPISGSKEPRRGGEKTRKVFCKPAVLAGLCILLFVAGLIAVVVAFAHYRARSSSLVQHDYYGSSGQANNASGANGHAVYGYYYPSGGGATSSEESSSTSNTRGSSSSSSASSIKSSSSSSSSSRGSSSLWGWFGGSSARSSSSGGGSRGYSGGGSGRGYSGGGSSSRSYSGGGGSRSYSGGGSRSFSGGGRSFGGGGYSACFPPGQARVLLAGQQEQVPIERVQPGSVLHLGGRVAAVMKLPALFDKDPLYHYNDSVLVTGSHRVQENGGGLIPVKESRFAVPVSSLASRSHTAVEPRFVYNLITANHRMVVNNATIFADWEEWENCVDKWSLERQLLRRLNDRGRAPLLRSPAAAAAAAPARNDDGTTIAKRAFSSGTPILLQSGSTVPIQDIQPGDELHHYNERDDDKDDGEKKENDQDTHTNRVFAVLKLWIPKGTRVYRYHNYKDNVSVTVTEWSIVLDDEDDGIWRNVQYSRNGELIGAATADHQSGRKGSSVQWYQLWTTAHKVPVTAAGILFADYHEIDEYDPILSELC